MNRLRQIRDQRGFSQKYIALTLGVKAPSVSNWEHGKTEPTPENYAQLASLYGVSVDYLMGRTDDPTPQKVKAKPGHNRIPVLGSIPAGIPIEAIEDIIDWEEIPADWTRGNKQYFALQVQGLSMYPEYRDGDVIVLKRQETAENGQDCAVSINGDEATFKRFRRTESGIMLQAINPDFEPLLYTEQQVAELPVRILGVVVELRRKIGG